MAKMIPANESDFNNSFGERKVYEALKSNLPQEYTVFHSFQWNTPRNASRNAFRDASRNASRNSPSKSSGVEWGEADFVVFHPIYGILVIEVKSGGIALEDGQWWYVRTDNQQRNLMKKDPLEQANRTKHSIIDLVRATTSELCNVESAVWFPSLADRKIVEDMPNTYHQEIVLMDWALENTRQAIENAYNFYDSKGRTKLSPQGSKLIVKTLAPAFNAVQSLSSLYAEQEYHFLRITNEQNGLLDYLDEQPTAVIQGSAGTGKTMLAVEKARRLSERSESDRVLFLCFNRFLMEDLRRKNQEHNIGFYNLPTLTKRETLIPGIPTDDEITEYLNNYDQVGNWDFKHIVIDEGQDFDSTHMNILSTIAAITGGVFYIFYDKNQLVQRSELPEWVLKAECRLVLRRNCRNTHSIATTAGTPVDVEPIMWEQSVSGKAPNFYLMQDTNELTGKLQSIITKYIDAKIPMSQIAILTIKKESISMLSGVNKIGKFPIVNVRGAEGILFTSARKFKGLESAVIIIIDVDASSFESLEMRNRFYVAASRARDFLDIMTVLDSGDLQLLNSALTGIEAEKEDEKEAEKEAEKETEKNVTANIASTLKVRVESNK